MFVKGKEKMAENVENTDLDEIMVNNPIIIEQNKLIAQFFQQITEMRAEMDKTRDLMNLAIIANTPTPNNGRTPLHFLLPIQHSSIFQTIHPSLRFQNLLSLT
uniref:Uncharacterized protein n=1 Tax=Solanum tuberosum TaxID=4113 RepID=M1E116_SOLTU